VEHSFNGGVVCTTNAPPNSIKHPAGAPKKQQRIQIPSATDSQDGLDGLPVEWNRRTSHIVTKLRETAKVESNQ
jgi:hypothetical protein